MTVGELIRILSKLNENQIVTIDYDFPNYDYCRCRREERESDVKQIYVFDCDDKEIHISTYKQSYEYMKNLYEAKGK